MDTGTFSGIKWHHGADLAVVNNGEPGRAGLCNANQNGLCDSESVGKASLLFFPQPSRCKSNASRRAGALAVFPLFRLFAACP